MSVISAEPNIRAVACRNPFLMERCDYAFVEGMTITQMLLVVNLPKHVDVLVYVGGRFIPADQYATTIPRQGELVAFRAVPTGGGGGGGKNPLRTILMVVVAVVAIAYAPALAAYVTGTAATGVSTAMAAMAITAVGTLIVNAVAPPPVASLGQTSALQSYKDSPNYALSGARNAISPYGPIPLLLGRHRITPPMGALPYTELAGDDQYLRSIFLLGYGPLLITDLKLGETPITKFTDVEYKILDGSGAVCDPIYAGDVFEDPLSIMLESAGGWQTRTTQPNTTRISLDIAFPQGLVQYADDGSRAAVTVAVEVQYAPTGTSSWSSGSSTGSYGAQTVGLEQISGGNRRGIVVLDKTTGIASVIYGDGYSAAYSGTDSEGYSAYYPATGSDAYPAVPSWAHGLAKITQSHVDQSWWIYYYLGSTFAIDADIRDATIRAGGFAVTTGTGQQVAIAGGSMTGPGFGVNAATPTVVRRNMVVPVATGQYDVRLRRVTADTSNDRIVDKVWWTAIRSHQLGAPITESGISSIPMRIKATEQLNGAVDDFNCVAMTICKDYNSATNTWIVRATNNPASLYRYVLQGAANKRPLTDAQIDLIGLQNWHTRCRTNRWTFNHYFDYRSSVDSVLQMIASAGRAAQGYVDGKYAVVMDQPQTNICQHFTPRNTWGYKYSKVFVDLPHAFRIKFWNELKGYKEDERLVYDDGYSIANASKFEELSLPGVSNADLAWKHGRYHIATARLRPEAHKFMADFESLTCTRGDLVRFQQDVIKVGLGAARIKSCVNDSDSSTTILTLDDEFGMAADKTYAGRVRNMDGTSTLLSLVTVAGIGNELVIDAAYPLAVLPEVGALFMFGEVGQESMELIIKNIAPSGDLTAEITAVDYAPAVHTSDTGAIPAFNSHITQPPDRWTLYVPVIDQIRSDESVMIRNSDGSYSPRLTVSLRAGDTPPEMLDSINVQLWETGTNNPPIKKNTQTFEVSFEGVEEGKTYSVKAQSIISGKPAGWTSVTSHTVLGSTAIPADVAEFGIAISGQQAFLSWAAVTVFDLAQYIIKFQPVLSGATWAGSSELVRVAVGNTSVNVPAKSGTYLIKAVDIGGRQSANATLIISNTVEISEMNVVDTITDGTGWAGTFTNTVKSGTTVELHATAGVFDTEGYYTFADSLDLGEVQTVRLSPLVVAAGENRTVDYFAPTDFFTAEDYFFASEVDWAVETQVRTSQDGTNYDSWRTLFVGDFNARKFQFRLFLRSLKVGVTPIVSAASISADMPDRFISGNDLAVTTGGRAITFSPAFYGLKGLGVNAQNLATGDYSVVTAKDKNGFTIIFRNAAGTAVARTFDYVAAGYGRKIT